MDNSNSERRQSKKLVFFNTKRHALVLYFHLVQVKPLGDMRNMNNSPKSLFFAFLGIGMAILAVDFLFVYLPLSGWILQSILVGVFLEYLKPKKTIMMVAIMEIFFITSYGGSVVIAAILSVVGIEFFLPVILGCYFGLIIAVFLLGCLTNYLLHKINLFLTDPVDSTDFHMNPQSTEDFTEPNQPIYKWGYSFSER